jgi:hypothetical protein
MRRPPTSIQLGPEDYLPLPVDQLCHQAQVSRAFIRLCIENGCPAPGGKLSHARLMDWLRYNYPQIRVASGLAPLAPIDGVPFESLGALQLANSLLTLLEYSESRSCDPRQKRVLRRVILEVEHSV